MGRFKQSLGVLAATTLTVACVGAGVASAATHPNAGTKAAWQAAISHVQVPGHGCYHASYPSLQWHAVQCVTARRFPVVPRTARHARPAAVGNGHDYSAQVSGLISKATGTFKGLSKGITEHGGAGGQGGTAANAFSLQLNTQFFTGSPACAGSSNPSGCQAWQQFVYSFEGCSVNCIFMQYWLINYNATCPAGWTAFSTDCYTNSNAVQVGSITAARLGGVKMSGSAASGGNDTVSLTIGSGTATAVSNSDSMIDLAAFWNTTEWGVFGNGGGSEAMFGANSALRAQTAITDSAGGVAPTCVSEGFTGETNNLNLAHTSALASQPSPTMASRQTNGTTGTPSCSTAP